MNRRGKIIVSITGIIIVLLALVGLTYGYFLTRIQGNTNTTSISVVTADLKLVYEDGNGIIGANNITPGTIFLNENGEGKKFVVTNDGNKMIKNYAVVIEDVNITYAKNGTTINGDSVTKGENTTFNRPEDFKYTLSCEAYTNYGNSNQTSIGKCNEQTIEAILPLKNSILLTNDIDKGITHVYELIVRYDNPYADQSLDMNKSITMKVNISDIRTFNPYNKGTLAYTLFTDNKVIKNNITPTFDKIASTDEGMFAEEDDYGVSWYYRGAQENNYVNFAGFRWRVVRINGDGSVRLILNGTLDKICNVINSNICKLSKYNDNIGNAYIGYMYGMNDATNDQNRCLILENGTILDKISDYTSQSVCEENNGKWTTTAYEAVHANLISSTVKGLVDGFYENFIKNSFSEFLTDSIFCGDKSIADGLGYGNNYTSYKASLRIGQEGDKIAAPTLKCAEGETSSVSRYSVESKNTISGVKTNGDLNYPIGLLSADEAIFAGAYTKTFDKNDSYYLYNSDYVSHMWWTMSAYNNNPSMNFVTNYVVAQIVEPPYNNSLQVMTTTADLGVRPVVNVRADALINGGDGTSNNPYNIEKEKVEFYFSNDHDGDNYEVEYYQVEKGTTFSQFIEGDGAQRFSLNSSNNVVYDYAFVNGKKYNTTDCFFQDVEQNSANIVKGDDIILSGRYYCTFSQSVPWTPPV